MNITFIKSNAASYLLIFSIQALVYSPVLFLDFEYTSDDNWMLLSNSNIWNSDIRYVLVQIFTKFDYGQYSPVNTLFYRLIYDMFGMSSVAFHCASLILHVTNTVLVYYLFILVSGLIHIEDKQSYLFCAILYGILPAHAEAVSWIAASKILGCTTFSLIAIILFLKGLLLNRPVYNFLVIGSLLVAFGFKEQAVVVPPLLIALEMTVKKRDYRGIIFNRLNMLVLCLAGAYWSYLGSRMIVYAFEEQNDQLGVLRALGRPIYCLFSFLYNAFIPVNLSVRYYDPPSGGYILLILIFLISLFIFYRKYSRVLMDNPDSLMGVLFFLISISCFINLIPLPRPSVLADRYLYFSSIGLILAVRPVVKYFLSKSVPKAIFIAYVVTLAVICYYRCQNWSFL